MARCCQNGISSSKDTPRSPGLLEWYSPISSEASPGSLITGRSLSCHLTIRSNFSPTTVLTVIWVGSANKPWFSRATASRDVDGTGVPKAARSLHHFSNLFLAYPVCSGFAAAQGMEKLYCFMQRCQSLELSTVLLTANFRNAFSICRCLDYILSFYW